jgi:hypothetical protein
VLAGVVPGALAAQEVRATGRVLRDSVGGRPLTGHWVVLHAMTRGGGGPVDSVRTGAGGRYAFAIPRVDSNAVYVVSAEYAGIAHFSDPLVLAGRLSAQYAALVVYDTTSVGLPVRLAVRFVTVGSARRDGAREVLEAVELQNPGPRTRIPADSTTPVWRGALPTGIAEWQVGESDVSAEAVIRRGDTVAVFAPLAPGGTKQISFAYVLPDTMAALRLPLDQPVGELLLLVEDTAAAVTAPGLETLSTDAVEGRRFARYRATAVPAGGVVEVRLTRPAFRAERLVPWIAGVAALALAAGLWLALRRPRPAE